MNSQPVEFHTRLRCLTIDICSKHVIVKSTHYSLGDKSHLIDFVCLHQYVRCFLQQHRHSYTCKGLQVIEVIWDSVRLLFSLLYCCSTHLQQPAPQGHTRSDTPIFLSALVRSSSSEFPFSVSTLTSHFVIIYHSICIFVNYARQKLSKNKHLNVRIFVSNCKLDTPSLSLSASSMLCRAI